MTEKEKEMLEQYKRTNIDLYQLFRTLVRMRKIKRIRNMNKKIYYAIIDGEFIYYTFERENKFRYNYINDLYIFKDNCYFDNENDYLEIKSIWREQKLKELGI